MLLMAVELIIRPATLGLSLLTVPKTSGYFLSVPLSRMEASYAVKRINRERLILLGNQPVTAMIMVSYTGSQV